MFVYSKVFSLPPKRRHVKPKLGKGTQLEVPFQRVKKANLRLFI